MYAGHNDLSYDEQLDQRIGSEMKILNETFIRDTNMRFTEATHWPLDGLLV